MVRAGRTVFVRRGVAFFASLAAWIAGFASLATVPCGVGVSDCRAVFLKYVSVELIVWDWRCAGPFGGFCLAGGFVGWLVLFWVLLVFLVGLTVVACGALVLVVVLRAFASPCILIGLLALLLVVCLRRWPFLVFLSVY
jgi:hypothetical protein